MGATIDPVTGMPNISGPEFDQIVLGAQTFPWDDLRADSRPARAAAYSDDLIPTTALLVGQKQENNLQVRIPGVTPDKRLMVDTGSSGGGSGPGPLKYEDSSPTFFSISAPGATLLANLGDVSQGNITSIQWCVRPDHRSPPAAGLYSLQLWLGNIADSAFDVNVCCLDWFDTDYNSPVAIFQGVKDMVWPIDTAASFTAGGIGLWGNASGGAAVGVVTLNFGL